MTVRDYFDAHGGVDIDSISDEVFNLDAWPCFDWPRVKLCVEEIIEKHGSQEFLGHQTLGMLMCWVMNLYKRRYGQNLPSGWYAVAKQHMASTDRMYMADGNEVGDDEDNSGEVQGTQEWIDETRKRYGYERCSDGINRTPEGREGEGYTVKDAAGVWQRG